MHEVEKLEAFVNNSDAMQQEINLQRLRADAAEVTAKGKRSAATTAETLAPTEEESKVILTRCQPNFYQSRCTRQPGLCDEGYHGYGGVCKPCGDGFFAATAGDTGLDGHCSTPCSVCALGQTMRKPCSATTDTVCQCVTGFDDFEGGFRCKPCNNGFVASRNSKNCCPSVAHAATYEDNTCFLTCSVGFALSKCEGTCCAVVQNAGNYADGSCRVTCQRAA